MTTEYSGSGAPEAQDKAEDAPRLGMSRRTVIAWLTVVVVLGSFLRLWKLDYQSLWNDELATWVLSRSDTFSGLLAEGAERWGHPPGYYLIMWATMQVLGDSEWALRFPSAIAGILVIPLMYLFGRRFLSEREGLIGATLLAALRWPVYYSQEACAYSILMLGALGSTWLFLEVAALIRDRDRVSVRLGAYYFAAAVAVCYLSYYGVIYVGLQLVALCVLAVIYRGEIALTATVSAAVALVLLPWVPVAIEVGTTGGPTWIQKPAPYLYELLRLHAYMLNDSYWLGGVGFVCAVGVFGLAMRRWRGSIYLPEILVLAWLLIPFTVVHVFSIYVRPILVPRGFVICAPALYFIIARMIDTLRSPRRIIAVTAVAATIALANFAVFGEYYTTYHKQNFRAAVHHILDQAETIGELPVVGNVNSPHYLDYYFERFGSPKRVDALCTGADDTSELLRAAAQGRRRVWFVNAMNIPDDDLIRYLEQNFARRQMTHFKAIDVLLLQWKWGPR